MSLRLVARHDGFYFEITDEWWGPAFSSGRKVSDRVRYYRVERYDRERNTHDYLQDSLEIAKECALDEWGVPLNAWREPTSEAETWPAVAPQLVGSPSEVRVEMWGGGKSLLRFLRRLLGRGA